MKSATTIDRLKPPEKEIACYAGLTVEVVTRMDNCSLIRYGGRELIVTTGDLRRMREATA